MDLPAINQRIKDLIGLYAKENVSNFSRQVGQSSQKINRLFNIDPRSKKYPEPSFEILRSITNTYSDIDINWLHTGEGQILKKESNDNTRMAAGGDQPKTNAEIEEEEMLKRRIAELESTVQRQAGQIDLLKELYQEEKNKKAGPQPVPLERGRQNYGT